MKTCFQTKTSNATDKRKKPFKLEVNIKITLLITIGNGKLVLL